MYVLWYNYYMLNLLKYIICKYVIIYKYRYYTCTYIHTYITYNIYYDGIIIYNCDITIIDYTCIYALYFM